MWPPAGYPSRTENAPLARHPPQVEKHLAVQTPLAPRTLLSPPSARVGAHTRGLVGNDHDGCHPNNGLCRSLPRIQVREVDARSRDGYNRQKQDSALMHSSL